MTIDILEKVGIKHATRQFDAYPHELSGGMRQRAHKGTSLTAVIDFVYWHLMPLLVHLRLKFVALKSIVMIAMALILKPQILIADEPTTALDASTQNQLLQPESSCG
jgi:peptide/nickel transport system ATP-binding protein